MLRYAITDPSYYGSDPFILKKSVHRVLSNSKIDMICLRDKNSPNYEPLARAFLSLKPLFENKLFFLHSDIDLALRLRADGVHLPSNISKQIAEEGKSALKVIVSTHSLKEAVECEQAGVYGITFGPVFSTPGKGPPKGLEKLKEITGKISINIFALGGILTPEHIAAVKRAGVDGFASIRYFVE